MRKLNLVETKCVIGGNSFYEFDDGVILVCVTGYGCEDSTWGIFSNEEEACKILSSQGVALGCFSKRLVNSFALKKRKELEYLELQN